MKNQLHTSSRLPSLDGWRALAILLVLGDHMAYTDGFPNDQFPWWGCVFQGNLGVRLFFVISGFLITYLLLGEADQSGTISLKNFYIRRALRIFPVYFVYLSVLLILSLAHLYSDSASSWFGSFTFTRNLIGQGRSATVHFWSLAVEEQFYFVWPATIVLFALWKRPKATIILLLLPLIACPIFRSVSCQPVTSTEWYIRLLGPRSAFNYADSLAIGCLGAFAYRERWLKKTSMWWDASLVGVILIVAALAWTGFTKEHHPFVTATIPGIQAFAMMVALYASVTNQSGVIFSLLNSRLLTWIGVLSYSIYIWHVIFLSRFMGPMLGKFSLYDWRVWWIPAITVAALSYYLVEKPILRMKTKFRTKNAGHTNAYPFHC